VAIYPAAVRKLIAPGSNDPRITPRVVILHVAVSNDDSLYDFFAHHSGGIESHFYVRDSGVVEEYRDTDWQADANYHANDFAISIETEGMGAGEWTPAQLASIKALLAWCHSTHGIPLVPCLRWDGTGVGYHSQFPEWSPVAKSCPGPERIVQYHNVLIPWMADDQQEDDMPAPRDWNKADWDAFERHVGDGTWSHELGGRKERAELVLLRAKDRAVQAATADVGAAVQRAVAGLALDVDEGRLAAEIIKQLNTEETP
jgi:hypothetical protein